MSDRIAFKPLSLQWGRFAANCVVALTVGLTFTTSHAAGGKALYSSCMACHGAKGEGKLALGAPNIAGMDDWYLKAQLENFAAGRRGTQAKDSYGAQMRAALGALPSAADRTAVAAYIAAMPRENAMPDKAKIGKADLVNGSTQYNALCSACHNANGKGTKALYAPRLAGTEPSYLERQYANFRTGVRGYHADDKTGKQMATISKMLPDAKAERDVLAFIGAMKP